MSFLDNLASLPFCILTSIGVRRPTDDLEPVAQPGSEPLGLNEDVWHQKYGNKKESLQNYLKYYTNGILNSVGFASFCPPRSG